MSMTRGNKMKQEETLTEEEQSLFAAVADHSMISRDAIVRAAEMMHEEAYNLDEGDISLAAIGKMFVDCADRAIAEQERVKKESNLGSSSRAAPVARQQVGTQGYPFKKEPVAFMMSVHKTVE